jgi:AMP deaminase
MKYGVYQVYADEDCRTRDLGLVQISPLKEFYADVDFIQSVITDGPTKSLAFRRLRYLQAQFNLYHLQNESLEYDDQRKVPHRDFYNVRKVDTHVHHTSSMNCKHLLRFIKGKLKTSPQDVVIFRDGKELTLEQVFQSLNLTAYDLSIDALDMHAHKDSFHRFDRFNLKYNPLGESRLREIFLKTDNLIKGRYLAELTREVMSDLETNKYSLAEYRLSIYGRSRSEWSKLASWVIDNNLTSSNVRWLIQIPRLFETLYCTNELGSFEQFLANIFEPLFEVTKDPSVDLKLHRFLCEHVVGMDTVDDESRFERRVNKKLPVPQFWTQPVNPPYSYYLYYLYANIAVLNQFRKARGLPTFAFRPHSGEAGDPEHLVAAFLLAEGINHGITLRKVPALQYL